MQTNPSSDRLIDYRSMRVVVGFIAILLARLAGGRVL